MSHESERWTMLRDLAVLQGKLIVDGLRDLLLVPASLIAGLISILSSDNGKPGPRPQYTPDYYGAFVHDPDGHNVEAVCRGTV